MKYHNLWPSLFKPGSTSTWHLFNKFVKISEKSNATLKNVGGLGKKSDLAVSNAMWNRANVAFNL